jgi:hypothetical protein
VLVLATSDDRVAGRVVSRLGASADAVWLTPADLVVGRWEHVVDQNRVDSRVRVRGEWHDLGATAATLNRLRGLPVPRVAFPSDADREYAVAERHALVLSVLAGLPGPVVNPPSPPSLSGPDLSPAAWLGLAASLGLPVRATSVTTDARRHPRPGSRAAHWPSLQPLDAGLPVGRRPVAWVAPVVGAVRCWLVGNTLVSDAALDVDARVGGLDLARLADAARCSLLEVVVGRDATGEAVVVSVEAHPLDVPPRIADHLVHRMLRTVSQR